ncbi:MAG: hypothetical protein ACHQRJ_24440 [Alphaproteobacteria bacterium]
MITNEEIFRHPEDPELAFVAFERILRDRLHEKENGASQVQWSDADSYRLGYINALPRRLLSRGRKLP